jgi:hypothetical protein
MSPQSALASAVSYLRWNRHRSSVKFWNEWRGRRGILLYTDGIVEAANANGEEFGQDRLGHLLLESDGKTAEQTAQLIESAVTSWSSGQNDDLTIIVCDYKPISSGIRGIG